MLAGFIIVVYTLSLAVLLLTGASAAAMGWWCCYFVGVQGLWRAAELRYPYRSADVSVFGRRSRTDVLLLLAKDAFVNLLMPFGVVQVAAAAQRHGAGLLHVFSVPAWFNVTVSVLVLDRLSFDVHRYMHKHPLLRDIHAVHHAGDAMDAGSVLRLHPLESLLRATVNVSAVVILGLSPLGIFVANAVRVFCAAGHHSAVYLPPALERRLSPWLTTPALHRLHHARDRHFYNSNYGQIFSFWDRLHGSFRPVSPSDPQSARVEVGIHDPRLRDQNDLYRLLLLPFRMRKKPS